MCLSHRPYNPILPAKDYTNKAFKISVTFRKKTEFCRCCSLSAPKPGMWVRVVCWSCPTHPNPLLAGAAGGADLAAAQPQPSTPKYPIKCKSLPLLPEWIYSRYSQGWSFSCRKIQAIIKEDSLGFRNTTIRWLKKTRKEFKTKEHHTGMQVAQKESQWICKEDTPHFFSQGKKATILCREMSF